MLNLIKTIYAKVKKFGVRPLVISESFRIPMKYYLKSFLRKRVSDTEFELAMLRKYAHIIDKGLQYEYWERGHSKEQYKRAKSIFHLLQSSEENDITLRWAGKIIGQYEEATRTGKRMNLSPACQSSKSPVTPDALQSFLHSRTSSRAFLEKKVSDETIRRIIKASAEAPTSCNRQTIRAYYSTDSKDAATIISRFKGSTCFSSVIPAALVFCVDLRSYGFPAEIFVPSLDSGLAISNALMMAQAEGLSTTVLTWAQHSAAEDQSLRKLLSIPDYYEVITGIVLGYAKYKPLKPARQAVEKILTKFPGN